MRNERTVCEVILIESLCCAYLLHSPIADYRRKLYTYKLNLYRTVTFNKMFHCFDLIFISENILQDQYSNSFNVL